VIAPDHMASQQQVPEAALGWRDHVIEELVVTRLYERVSERKGAEHRYRDEE
jgi:hypothetical protein